MFNMIGIGERAGSGVPDIYSVWDRQGWEQPEVEERYSPDRTVLTLKFDFQRSTKVPKSQGDTLDDTLELLVKQKISSNRKITQIQLAKELNISVTTVKRVMKSLSDKNEIVRVGGKRFGYWDIIS